MNESEWDRLIADLRSADDLDRAVEAARTLGEVADQSRVRDLERLIEDDDFFVREAAAGPLCRLKGLDALPLLLQASERGSREGHDNDGLSTDIIDLIESHKAEAVPMLLAMLEDTRDEARSQAAWLLGFVSELISPEPLIGALKDTNPDVRSSAVGSLSSFRGHEGVLEAMLPLLKDGDEQVRVDAASALGYLGDRRAMSSLRDALTDPSERVREFADYSLGQLKVKR